MHRNHSPLAVVAVVVSAYAGSAATYLLYALSLLPVVEAYDDAKLRAEVKTLGSAVAGLVIRSDALKAELDRERLARVNEVGNEVAARTEDVNRVRREVAHLAKDGNRKLDLDVIGLGENIVDLQKKVAALKGCACSGDSACKCEPPAPAPKPVAPAAPVDEWRLIDGVWYFGHDQGGVFVYSRFSPPMLVPGCSTGRCGR